MTPACLALDIQTYHVLMVCLCVCAADTEHHESWLELLSMGILCISVHQLWTRTVLVEEIYRSVQLGEGILMYLCHGVQENMDNVPGV